MEVYFEEKENNIKLVLGDCLEVLKDLGENSIDSVVTDPPYGISFLNMKWDCLDKKSNYMKEANGIYQFSYKWAKEVFRVLKPGGYLLSFGATRMYHRMVCGIEDAGFEVKDCILWVFGKGFPQSLDIAKSIDKLKGVKGKVVKKYDTENSENLVYEIYEAESAEAKEWEGWRTKLKPAVELVVLARKPISEKNIVLNVLKWGTGGLNIDECRIGHNEKMRFTNRSDNVGWNKYVKKVGNREGRYKKAIKIATPSPKGRYPANVVLECICDELDNSSNSNKEKHTNDECICYLLDEEYKNSSKGGVSRFFYNARAEKSERNLGLEYSDGAIKENLHPTVKPVRLCEYLVKLITRKGGVVLDPFTGSGTVGVACKNLGCGFVGIEKEKSYIDIAVSRIKGINLKLF